jgi:predicted GNAT superfamily acetyltransferase
VVWTFDPLETRNGHFNLNRLGAISRKYLANLYGVTTSPLHWGLATDRLWVEWWLDSARVMKAVASDSSTLRASEWPFEAQGKQVASENPQAQVEVPAELEEWKKSDTRRVAEVQARMREEFTRWFAKGYAAVGVRKTETGAAYALAPWSEF